MIAYVNKMRHTSKFYLHDLKMFWVFTSVNKPWEKFTGNEYY